MDDQDQVSPAAFERTVEVPNAFVVTFGWGPGWWLNQENGLSEDPPPTVKHLLTGQEP